MKNTWEKIVVGPWPYWIGAIVLAILNVLVLYIRKEPWGITTNIEHWAEWLGASVGIVHDKGFSFQSLIHSNGTYLNLGVILGALWATLLASQARFRPIRKKKYLISGFFGGVLMGYGARIAYGCNIGALLNGIASNSLTGWIFALAVIAGTWIGTKILLRFLM